MSNASRTREYSVLSNVQYEDDVLMWGRRSVLDIAEEIGSTPFFAYDRDAVTTKIRMLRRVLPENIRLYYAVKANPMPGLIQHVASEVDGFDVASAGELELAASTSVNSQSISFAGPGKRDFELRDAIVRDVSISLESESEMHRVAKLADRIGLAPKVTIRVNPDFELKRSGMKMGGRASPFGVDVAHMRKILGEISQTGLRFSGFHIFAGSQNLDASALAEYFVKAAHLVVKLGEKHNTQLSTVNIGGGLGIPYFANQRPLELEPVTHAVSQASEIVRRDLGIKDIVLELGRFLVGEAGIYVVRVVDIKESYGKKFVITDGGMHHHLAAAGQLGQVIRRNYPIVNVLRSSEPATVCEVVGPLCTPLDILGDAVELHPMTRGSLLAILQSGAYGRSASPSGFLSHPEAKEILV